MWIYRDNLDEIFEDYYPDKTPYSLQIDITDDLLYASEGSETRELTVTNNGFLLKVHVFPEKAAPYITTKEFAAEEEALLAWLSSLEIGLTADRNTKARVTQFCNYLYSVIRNRKKGVRSSKTQKKPNV